MIGAIINGVIAGSLIVCVGMLRCMSLQRASEWERHWYCPSRRGMGDPEQSCRTREVGRMTAYTCSGCGRPLLPPARYVVGQNGRRFCQDGCAHLATQMEVVCASCKAVLKVGGAKLVSHGSCGPCAEVFMAEIANRERPVAGVRVEQ
jgi:hypothetical protein